VYTYGIPAVSLYVLDISDGTLFPFSFSVQNLVQISADLNQISANISAIPAGKFDVVVESDIQKFLSSSLTVIDPISSGNLGVTMATTPGTLGIPFKAFLSGTNLDRSPLTITLVANGTVQALLPVDVIGKIFTILRKNIYPLCRFYSSYCYCSVYPSGRKLRRPCDLFRGKF
jgi:hypothetical protein